MEAREHNLEQFQTGELRMESTYGKLLHVELDVEAIDCRLMFVRPIRKTPHIPSASSSRNDRNRVWKPQGTTSKPIPDIQNTPVKLGAEKDL